MVYPAAQSLISRWAPPAEKGKFSAALMGNTLGTVVTWPLLGVIIENMGWIWAFFTPGAIAILWAIIWWFTVADSPQEHWWISDEEKNYIINSLNTGLQRVKVILKIKIKITTGLKKKDCRYFHLIPKFFSIYRFGL